jgi:predicted ATPase
MISQIKLDNLKACKDVELSLGRLTVLSGLNSSGKSTILQSLALLKQSYIEGNSTGLLLNSELVSLGNANDLLNENSDQEYIRLKIKEGRSSYEWKCKFVSESELLEYIKQPNFLPSFLTGNDFQYLQANRMVPQEIYPKAPRLNNNQSFLGTHGEYTVDYLRLYKNENLTIKHGKKSYRLRDSRGSNTLLDHTELWLQMLSPGVRLQLDDIKFTGLVRLGFQYKNSNNVISNQFRPGNVGFGLSYSLPIVVACLSAPRGALILLENPEAHLHPKGQVAMGELLAKTAADGVQVIVETHSDHLLNGIRLSVKKGTSIKSKDVRTHFLKLDAGESKAESPEILETGRLSYWPEGFFDQWDKSLDDLLS